VGNELAVDAVAPRREHQLPLGVVEEEHRPLHRRPPDDRLTDPVVEVVELALLVQLEKELDDHIQGLGAERFLRCGHSGAYPRSRAAVTGSGRTTPHPGENTGKRARRDSNL
jgi:hypothetical protein